MEAKNKGPIQNSGKALLNFIIYAVALKKVIYEIWLLYSQE